MRIEQNYHRLESESEMQKLRLIWGAWFEDRELILRFPSSWEIEVTGSQSLPHMDTNEMRMQLQFPLNSKALSDLAKTRKKAAILIDDMTRPTPSSEILPLVLEALEAGGMKPESITIIIAGADHEGATPQEITRKTGARISGNVSIQVHDSRENLIFLGYTQQGTPIHVNRTVLSCDLKIGIGCIVPHPIAGFSGGSKIAAPGICGRETIRHLHDYLQLQGFNPFKGSGQGGFLGGNKFKKEIDAVCDRIGMDFFINVVLNHERKVMALYAGSREAVHNEGVRLVKQQFQTNPSAYPDIIISNTYPFDTNLRYMSRGYWPFHKLAGGITPVVIGFAGDGPGRFGSRKAAIPFRARLLNRLSSLKINKVFHEVNVGVTMLQRLVDRKRVQYLFFCPNITQQELSIQLPQSRVFDSWDAVLNILKQKHQKKKVKVLVYPYAPLQFPMKDIR